MKEYRIYIKSNKYTRNINTPMMGRTNYEVITVEGKESFIAKLNELAQAGEEIRKVHCDCGGSYVYYREYIPK